MLYSLVLALLAPAAALRADVPAQSRRAILTSAAAVPALFAPLAANAVPTCARIEAGGGQGSADCVQAKLGSTTSFKDYKKPRDQASVVIGGKYADPNHPGMARNIITQGSSVFISGADEDGSKFKLTGKLSGRFLVADFSPKGGPSDLTAEVLPLVGLKFPDGNVWAKL